MLRAFDAAAGIAAQGPSRTRRALSPASSVKDVTVVRPDWNNRVFDAAAGTTLLVAVTLVALLILGRVRGHATLR